jgi:16S rRNA (cytidine1402-2'-O)-methyltransferase
MELELMGILYLVATPIGNLEDITLRALKVLGSVDLIAAEDTRTTRALLTHYDIHTALTSNHNLNERSKITDLLEQLQSKDIAVVSDAGSPLINDPGFPLVQAAVAAGIKVVSIPGPSSPITALSISGLPTDQFTFLGYIPRKNSERKEFFQQAGAYPTTLIFLETPHRIRESLAAMLEIFGDRDIAVCREMTKLFEEVIRGPISRAISHFASVDPMGEFTLVVSGKVESHEKWSENRMSDAIRAGWQQGKRTKDISKELAEQSCWNSKEIYTLAESLK